MNYYPFDSRNPLYRTKLGAIAEGETLRLKVLLHKDAHVHEVFLKIRNDSEQTEREARMFPSEWLEDYRFYECDINLTEGLYWYSFRYTSDYGEFFVTKTETSLGIVSNGGACWQQTVFSKDFKTPDWLAGGIIYQIFPDRFYNSGIKKQNVPADRYICNDWEKQPEFRQPNSPCRLGNDYYGGDLKGIEEKLPYIKELGVNCIYLNPIFEAHSNHRYNTADYFKIDASLGSERDLEDLIESADKLGISIILDGVFSHTGDDSVYFNKYGRYDSLGAFQSQSSPYYKWFNFSEYPHKYNSWWGITTLPETDENDLSFSNFITGENGVLRYWLKKGIKGWRLDVADELPDSFLDKIRLSIKAEGQENYLLGEVWEDATNKVSYGYRRRFLRGKQLDSVMNYPFANAIVDYVKTANSANLLNTVLNILENYPPQSVKLLMNHIGTHDTARILTRLGSDYSFEGDRESQSRYSLSHEQYLKAVKLLKLAAVLQYTLPGVPSLYYGDEAGIQGFGDPFCRKTYPWGKENTELLSFYKDLGNLRNNTDAFKTGDFIPLYSNDGVLVFMRKSETSEVLIAINASDGVKDYSIPQEIKKTNSLLGICPNLKKLTLPPYSFSII
ncbi:MAG: glycoside hydrolase family 13 protein [Clostridia bacterium]|nr:glycoside hydrolase family 13 protein [Clostridia bacterium]